MTAVCSKKCVTKFAEGELHVGEMTCVDRCTGKYLHAHGVVGDILQAFEAQMKNQQEAMAKFS
jgi:import inner membrane translocase subunit TIM10